MNPCVAVGSKSSDLPDDFPALRTKLEAPDVFGILMGSPVYMGIISSPLKNLFERMLAFRQGGFPLANKVGGTMQSQGEDLSNDEGSLNTVRGVGKRVAEIALRMAASAR